MLNEKFVPFAPGWFINTRDEVYQQAWKRFYVAKPRKDEGNGWLRGTKLVLMTSAGRLLSGSMKYGDRKSLAPALQKVLKAYAKLPEAQRRPLSVKGSEKPQVPPPPGGLVLTIYDRPLARTSKGRYRLPQDNDLDGLRTHASHGQRSSLWLTAKECRSLIPKTPRQGQTYVVPTKLTKRIYLYGMWPQTLWVVEHTWQPDSLRKGKLELSVQEVSPLTVRFRVHGSVVLSAKSRLRIYPTGRYKKNLENRYDARVEGTLVYDRAKSKIIQWKMVALGDYTGAMFTDREKKGRRIGDTQWREATSEAPVPLGFAFKLDNSAYEVPAQRRRPRSFVHAYIFRNREPFYFDPDKWLQDWQKRKR